MQLAELSLGGLPEQVLAAGHGGEGPGANHAPLLDLSLGGEDRRREAHDLALLRDLALELEPQQLEILGRGQLGAAAQAVEELLALAELGAGE